MHPIFAKATPQAIPVWFASKDDLAAVLAKLDAAARGFAKAAGFEGKAGQHLLLPGAGGKLSGALFGQEGRRDANRNLFGTARLIDVLPPGTSRFANAPHDVRLAALAFALGSYQFARYRKGKTAAVKLVLPAGLDGDELTATIEAVTLARDLINTPSND